MKKLAIRWGCGLALLLVLVGHAAGYFRLLFVDSLDNLIYDARLRLTMPGTRDDRITIVDIDEKSLAQVGRWPWGRDRMTELVDRLFERDGVAMVGFDVVMAEPDHSSGLASLDTLARGALRHDAPYLAALNGLRSRLDYDARFAASLNDKSVVLGYYLANQGRSSGVLPEPVLHASARAGDGMGLTDWSSYGGNLAAFQRAAADGGFFNPIVDFDGNVRRVPMIARQETGIYQSLSLAMVRMLSGRPDVVPVRGEGGRTAADRSAPLEAVLLPTPRGVIRIPVDEHAAALVPYRGYQGSFRYVSASDVLADRVPRRDLQGRIVLVGTTAPGLVDLRSTPVGRAYPGVEIHANLIGGMLDGTIKHAPGYANAAEVLVLLVVGALMIFIFPRYSPWRSTVASAALLATVVAGDFSLWQYANWVLPLAASVLLIVGLFGLNMSLGYFVESRTKRQFANLFGQYVPPELVEEMSRRPESYSMRGRRAQLTVLFSDVRGFTTISESLAPERLAELMNDYLDTMTAVIRTRRGTLDKYIGDAIMAFWGAPVADADHARNAVAAALDMQAALPDLNRRFAGRGWPTLEIGIGINTGPMAVGDMGSAVRKSYTVMGDAVNLGARLEGVTKFYGVGIVVGEATRDLTPDMAYRELDRVKVKGKHEPVAIYEPLGEPASLSPDVREEAERWHQALACFRARDWEAAAALLGALADRRPHCRLYALYLDRIAQLGREGVDPGWDGVYTFDSK